MPLRTNSLACCERFRDIPWEGRLGGWHNPSEREPEVLILESTGLCAPNQSQTPDPTLSTFRRKRGRCLLKGAGAA